MAIDYMAGAIDMHIHVGPDDGPRYYDCIDLARDASSRGMEAVVIKDHLFPSVSKAVLATRESPMTKVFGGISLNNTVGGLNPRSVVSAIRTGAKVVWMPTVDAAFCIAKGKSGHWIKEYIQKKSFGSAVEGITILDEEARLRSPAEAILDLCRQEDIVLSSGHIGPEECIALAEGAARRGFEKLLICHPNAWLEDFTDDVLKMLAGHGAYLELTFGACSPLHGRQNPRLIADIIRLVGPERCVLSTDYGQVECSSPPEGLRMFCVILSKCGIPDEAIATMTRKNPRMLLGLEG